jgi:branched-subunit amino acid transport protein
MSAIADSWTVLTIVGLTVVTVVTRTLFFWSSKPWQLPAWLQRGLQYAPIAALSAVVVPELVMTEQHLISGLLDARLFAAAAGSLWFFSQRGKPHAVLGTIVLGMLIYLPLHLGLGW